MKTPPPIKPPRLASKLFEWWCKRASTEDLQGDIEELFYSNRERMSPWSAKIEYWKHVVSLIFSYALEKRKQRSAFHPHSYTPIHPAMIKSYFKIAWRTIGKNKVYSVINVLGLALGICACLTIYIITIHEFSFDTFHPDMERIYRVNVESNKTAEKWISNCVPAPAPAAIRDELSGFEVVTGFHRYDPKVSIPDGDKPPVRFERSTREIIIAEPDYFNLFHYQWLAGNPGTLNEPFKVVLSERKARTYFGSQSWDKIIGREVVYDDSLRVSVSGIVKDWDKNTDFPFTDFISFSSIQRSFLKNGIHLDDWYSFSHSSQGFVKLKTGASPVALNTQLTALFKKHRKEDHESTPLVKLEPLSLHFFLGDGGSSSFLSTLYALIVLALFILIIAAINFVNLSTAQSIRRSKEIGIRKVLGSLRVGLALQFLVETFVITLFALVLAILLVRPVLSGFDSYIPHGVTFDLFSSTTLLFLLLITIGTSLLAGFYPAKIMSSYLPSASLKGVSHSQGSGKHLLRKGLIVFQFSLSLFFIIGALVMSNQIRFIRTTDRGFNTKAVVIFWTNFDDKGKGPKILVSKIKALIGVDKVTLQGGPAMGFAQIESQIVYKGKSVVETSVSLKDGSADFIPLYQIPLLAGRNIVESDSLKEFVINETYSRLLGFSKPEEAIGQILYFNNKPYPIVGVADNFHERSFHDPIGPAVIANFLEFQHCIAIKLSSNMTEDSNVNAVMVRVEKLYKQLYPDEKFEYHFIEDEIGWMHDGERKTASLVNVAMAITIFISCMGIFGLAMFTAEARTKEIGIRKVLGASVTNITAMLNKEFLVLIGAAILIASPIAWYFMNHWLQEFAYRIDLTIWVFVLSGLAALSIGLITVSFQTIKAALANPANSLKEE